MRNTQHGRRLKSLRLMQGLSQRALAQLLSTHHSTVSRWESGQCLPEPELLPQLAEFLGEEMDWLIEPGSERAPRREQVLEERLQEAFARIAELERFVRSSQSFYLGVSALTLEAQ